MLCSLRANKRIHLATFHSRPLCRNATQHGLWQCKYSSILPKRHFAVEANLQEHEVRELHNTLAGMDVLYGTHNQFALT